MLLLAGCHDPTGPAPILVKDPTSQTIVVDLGREVDIQLGTGSGVLGDAAVSSDAVKYLGSHAIVVTPAGGQVLYRFQTLRIGQAVVSIVHFNPDYTVQDTIVIH